DGVKGCDWGDGGGLVASLDGTAAGAGSLSGFIFANTNDGRVLQVSLATNASGGHDMVVIAQGGTRGDFVAVDPHNGTLLLTQSSNIVRLHPPAGGSFLPPPPYRYPVRAIDADSDPVTYSLIQSPPGMTIDPHSGVITWDAASTALTGTVHFTDGDFNPGNWETEVFETLNVSNTVDVSTISSGGDPGAYR